MRRRTVLFFIVVSAIVTILAVESAIFATTSGRGLHKETKSAAVRLIGLPDLGVATEARFLRFRSLSDIFAPFNEGPEMLDYFPAAFTYAPSPVMRKVPSMMNVAE
jgi:hypothetical protein